MCWNVFEALIHEFKYIAENINLKKWRDLVRTLGVTDADIDLLAEQYPTNVREQIHRALLLWERRSGVQASRALLTDALRNCQLCLLADNLESLCELQWLTLHIYPTKKCSSLMCCRQALANYETVSHVVCKELTNLYSDHKNMTFYFWL